MTLSETEKFPAAVNVENSMSSRSLLASVLIFALTACDTGRISGGSDPRAEILSGLGQETRRIAISIENAPPNSDFEVYEQDEETTVPIGEGARKGMGLALQLGSTGAGAEPEAVILGIILLPVLVVRGAVGGAFVGATMSETTMTLHPYPLDEVEGIDDLRQAISDNVNLLSLLEQHFSGKAEALDGHKTFFISTDKLIDTQRREVIDVQIRTKINTYALVGAVSENPRMSLFIQGETTVEARWTKNAHICKWVYTGSERKLSEWSADDAQDFVSENLRAAKEIAEKILASLRRGSPNCPDVRPIPASEILALLAAAKSKDPKGQFALYRSGKLDRVRFEWLCRSAENGYAIAQEELGDLYSSRRGEKSRTLGFTELNPIQAYKWYGLAQANGLRRAGFFKNQLEQVMAPEQITKAKQLVANWKPDPAKCGVADLSALQ